MAKPSLYSTTKMSSGCCLPLTQQFHIPAPEISAVRMPPMICPPFPKTILNTFIHFRQSFISFQPTKRTGMRRFDGPLCSTCSHGSSILRNDRDRTFPGGLDHRAEQRGSITPYGDHVDGLLLFFDIFVFVDSAELHTAGFPGACRSDSHALAQDCIPLPSECAACDHSCGGFQGAEDG